MRLPDEQSPISTRPISTQRMSVVPHQAANPSSTPSSRTHAKAHSAVASGLAEQTDQGTTGQSQTIPLAHKATRTTTDDTSFLSASQLRGTPESETHSPWSDSLQTLLDQPPARFPTQVLMAGLAFTGIFVVWSSIGTMQEVGHAQGRLIPEGDVYKVQPVVQGEVSQLFVEEGDVVQAGQKIAELDRRLLQMDLEKLQEELAAHQRQLTQTQALIARTHLEAQTHKAIASADIRAQQAELHATQADINTVHQLMSQLQSDVDAYETRLARLNPLVEDGAIAEDNLFEIEQALRDRTQALIRNEGEIDKQQAELDRLSSTLQQSRAHGRRSELESQQKLQQLEIDTAQIEAEIVHTEMLVKSAQTQLQQLSLYAPLDGTILSLDVSNIGEVIQAGQTVAEIAPTSSELVLSATLPSEEAGLVQEDMAVNMKFDAFPYQDYGILSGHVISISPDAEIDPNLGSIYEVSVALERNYVVHNQRNIPLKAGQTATAEIVIRKRRIIDVLLDPIRQLQKSGINL